MTPSRQEPAVKMTGIHKSYGAVRANNDLELTVPHGTIHGILGENGAGKSTAMKILYGMVRPDCGEIATDGMPRRFHSPMDARAVGIGMVHQHFMLADALTALDNIILGSEPFSSNLPPRLFRRIDRARARAEVEEIMTRYGIGVPLMQPVGTLAVGEQQRIEILRLLYRKARILILDEPTAVLTPPEVEKLFIQLKNLAGEGRTILIVTHKLHELTALTDAITIMRAGRAIITVPTCEADVQKLAFLMVGERFHPVANSAQSAPHGSPVLSLRGLKLAPRFRNAACASRLDLDLYGGEIVGLAGVEGNGQSELIQALLDPAAHRHGDPHGSMHFAGEDMRRWPSRKVLAAGIAFVPPDRHHEGLLLHDDVVKNCALAWQRQRRFLRGPFLRWRALRKETKALLDEWQVSPPDAELGLHGFSGGNQQKILVGREMAGNPRLVIAAHPTRGVDIGAVQLIHRRLLDLKDAGATILLISSDLDEIRMLSDRIAVLENFRIVRIELARTWDETTLGLAMSGAPLMPGLGIEP